MNAVMRTSDLARPPVTTEEMRMADTAICTLHNGLIRQTGDRDGRVFYCPIGRMYWRYTRTRGINMHSALKYPKSGVV